MLKDRGSRVRKKDSITNLVLVHTWFSVPKHLLNIKKVHRVRKPNGIVFWLRLRKLKGRIVVPMQNDSILSGILVRGSKPSRNFCSQVDSQDFSRKANTNSQWRWERLDN